MSEIIRWGTREVNEHHRMTTAPRGANIVPSGAGGLAMNARIPVLLMLLSAIGIAAAAEPSEPLADRHLLGEYLTSRHIDPWHVALLGADARLAALKQRQGAERRLKLQRRAAASAEFAPAWVAIGPAPMTGGQTPANFSTPSAVSGRVTAIAIDPVDAAVFIGSANGGVWRSTDSGGTWHPLTDHLGSLAIGSIAVSRQNANPGAARLYVGTGEGDISCDGSYLGVGIYISADSGDTWSGPFGSMEFGNRSVPSIVVDRANALHLVAVSSAGTAGVACVLNPLRPNRGIFYSNDGGETWTQATAASLPADVSGSVVLQDPHDAASWWAAMYTVDTGGGPQGGLYRSTDGGVTWVQQMGVASGLPALTSALGRVWIAGADGPEDSVLYVGTSQSNSTSSDLGRLYKSADSGGTWTEVTAARGYCQPSCFNDMPVHVEPGNASVVYTGGASSLTLPAFFRRSDDGGATFSSKFASLSTGTSLHSGIHAILSWPGNDSEIWVGTSGGIWRSTDRGNTWLDRNTSLQITRF